MQKIGVIISLCVVLQTAATRSLDLEAERESNIDKRHLKLLGDLMKTPEAQEIVKNAMNLFGNILSPGKHAIIKRKVFRSDNLNNKHRRNTPPFQLWNGLERLSFPEFPAGNSGKDDFSKLFESWNGGDVSDLDEDEDLDSLVLPEELQQTLATRTLNPNFFKGLGELMKTPEAQEIAKNVISLLGKALAPGKRDILEWNENMDSLVEELASMLED